MRRSGLSSRRWRAGVWCGLCVLCLATLALRDTLHYLLPEYDTHRKRWCLPPLVEVDGCTSWRPLLLHHPTCPCTRKVLVLHDTCSDIVALDAEGYLSFTQENFGDSTCSDQATLRGPRQHVISISSKAMTNADLTALNSTITQVNEVYKGWVLRLYTEVTPQSLPGLCSLVCSNHNLDLCDVNNMSNPVKKADKSGRVGWRWAILGDPLVSAWVVRHLYQALLPREAHAITQFINSDKCWHLMWDHITHTKSPLGSGLVGGKTSWGAKELINIRRHLLQEISNFDDEELLLKELLLPLMGADIMAHDSVTCRHTPGAVPFPSRRQPGHWVGMPSSESLFHLGKTSNMPTTTHKHEKKTLKHPTQGHSSVRDYPEQDKSGIRLVDIKDGTSIKVSQGTGQQSQFTTHTSPKVQKSNHASHKKKVNLMSHKMQRLDPAWEAEVNKEFGIPVCPSACRPLLHPDWDYC
ncbi:uncharacterized protein LOC121873836 [Homarus americanus]|uniref:Uncharacterized protein n=1 Tax=Homarus americanus TaxID=6706 RepID=A0A8J5JQW9_HOMAM|nr:uncharacterized protein LOC121873836 [Homarus americanus]KAG7162510.1 hypothetical protein Hamer_G008064 [Homarus americanus]